MNTITPLSDYAVWQYCPQCNTYRIERERMTRLGIYWRTPMYYKGMCPNCGNPTPNIFRVGRWVEHKSGSFLRTKYKVSFEILREPTADEINGVLSEQNT